MKKYFYSLFLLFVFTLLPGSFVLEANLFEINVSHAQETDPLAGGTSGSASTDGFESGCDGGGVTGIPPARSWLGGCLTPLLVTASGYVLFAAAGTFDFFLQVTLEPDHLRSNYIANTWATMRDLANITFILGIIAIAFMMISGFGGDWKRTGSRLIIVALVLNFSLFFSQIVIDAGNLTAGVFWEQIKASGLPNSPYSTLLTGDKAVAFAGTTVDQSGAPSPSAPIVSSLNLVQSSDGGPGLLSIDTVNTLSSNGNSQGFLFALNALIILVTVLVGKSLFVTGFMFLTRTVVLTILMIVSPLAFVCYFFPGGQKYWGMWLSHLVAKSFCVVCYLFFIFLLLKILEGTTLGSATDFANSPDQVTLLFLFIAVNTGIIFVVLGIANKVATSMCEGGVTSIGSTIGKAVLKTGVGAAVLATGGAAGFAGRATIGRLGHRMANTAGAMAGDPTSARRRFLGQVGLFAGEKLENAKFGKAEGYKAKLATEGGERKNTYDKIYNHTQAAEEKKLTAILKQDKKNVDKDGNLTDAAKKQVKTESKEKADVAGQNYLDSIAPSVFDGEGKATFGSVLDTMLAGGVSAGAEGRARVEATKKADSNAEEKAKKLRLQQMDIERDQNGADQLVDGTTDDIVAEIKTLEDIIITNGINFDSEGMKKFKKAIMKSHEEIIGYNPDGSAQMKLTEKAKEDFTRTWDQFENQIKSVSDKAVIESNEVTAEQENISREHDINVASERQVEGLLAKVQNSKQKGKLDADELTDQEKFLAEDLGVVFNEEGGIDIDEKIAGDIREHKRDLSDATKESKKKVDDLEKRAKKIKEDYEKASEKVVNATRSVAKKNNKAVATTSRSTLNARLENITEERTYAQEESENTDKLTTEYESRLRDSDAIDV